MNSRRVLAVIALSLSLAAMGGAALAGGGAGGGEKKKGGGQSFIQIQTLTATIVRSDGRRGVMTVEAGVDVTDGALRTRAEASTPRLRAAFAQKIRTYAASLPPGALPDAEYLSRELQRETDAVLGKSGARLLLGTILSN